jgi:hypothetical protein
MLAAEISCFNLLRRKENESDQTDLVKTGRKFLAVSVFPPEFNSW